MHMIYVSSQTYMSMIISLFFSDTKLGNKMPEKVYISISGYLGQFVHNNVHILKIFRYEP